jgi:hypothetical protein
MALAKFYEDLIERKFESSYKKLQSSEEIGETKKINLEKAISELNNLKQILLKEIQEAISGSEIEIISTLKLPKLQKIINELNEDKIQLLNKVKDLEKKNESLQGKIKHQKMLNKLGDREEENLKSQFDDIISQIENGDFERLARMSKRGSGLIIEIDKKRKTALAVCSAGKFFFSDSDTKKCNFEHLKVGKSIKFTISSHPRRKQPGRIGSVEISQ